MQLVIVTGMSGSGKTLAIRAFEDMGYICVDNIPPSLLPSLPEIYRESESSGRNIAAVVDVRSGHMFPELIRIYPELTEYYRQVRILFLEASDEVLIQRFKETRRRHPLFENCQGIINSIACERQMLSGLKELADKVMDTSDLDPGRLKSEIVTCFGADSTDAGLIITVISFGFKYGIPLDADLVFDVRFLTNPYYVPELRSYDGRDNPVQEFVMGDERTGQFITRLRELIEFALPHYEKEGKAYLNIAIGCTGGRHRSVVIANELAAFLRCAGYRIIIDHRDVSRAK